MNPPITSDRLDLASMTPAFLRASLRGDLAAAQRHLAAALPDGWPGGHSAVLALRLEQLEEDASLQPWLLRALVLRSAGVMVGTIGFHTAPGAPYLEPFSPGAVEFGFSVFPPFRRQGYAREAARALMRWAVRAHGVTKFVVTISPENTASQALAAELGFVRIGSHLDEVDGIEDVLECRVAGPDTP